MLCCLVAQLLYSLLFLRKEQKSLTKPTFKNMKSHYGIKSMVPIVHFSFSLRSYTFLKKNSFLVSMCNVTYSYCLRIESFLIWVRMVVSVTFSKKSYLYKACPNITLSIGRDKCNSCFESFHLHYLVKFSFDTPDYKSFFVSIFTTYFRYRTRANKWRSRSAAAPLKNHAKSHSLWVFYVMICGLKW